MKISNNVVLAITALVSMGMDATTTSAFAPTTFVSRNNQHKTLHTSSVQPSTPQTIIQNEKPKTTLFNTNKDSNESDEQLKQFEKTAEDYTKFLIVDTQKVQQHLAENWGWIVGSGVVTMLLGLLSLTTPIFTTGVAYDVTVYSVAALGIAGLINVFIAENGHKLKSAVSGLGYSGLAYYMGTHPAQGLDIITLTIATVIAAEGLYEAALAVRNENLQGRAWHFTSGVVSTLAGLWLSISIPAASLVAPGAALGTRLASNGASKVAIGLAGKELADKRK